MLIGYGRVGTAEEDAAGQGHALVRAGVAAARCPSCGNQPILARERVRHRQDLAMTWLYPDPRHPDRVLERRHCAVCQPRDHVAGVECGLCADGPILAGRLAERGADADPVRAWLVGHGWRERPGLGLVCARHPVATCRSDVLIH